MDNDDHKLIANIGFLITSAIAALNLQIYNYPKYIPISKYSSIAIDPRDICLAVAILSILGIFWIINLKPFLEKHNYLKKR